MNNTKIPSPAFNVLDPKLDLNQHMVLEASAGTGKTFSIQHLVVRYLLQQKIPIDRILLVTFTNASTRELRTRVAGAIGSALDDLRSGFTQIPYLAPFLEDEADRFEAIRLLDEAWFQLETAQIFTLHKFCSRMLQENFLSGDTPISKEEKNFSNEEMRTIVRDLFRTLSEPEFSPAQIGILIRKFKDDPDDMIDAIVKLAGRKERIVPKKNFAELKNRCLEILGKKKIETEKLVEDFSLLAIQYTKLHPRGSDEVKPEILAKVIAMGKAIEAGDIDELIREKLPFPGLLQEMKKRVPAVDFSKLNYPGLKERFEADLVPAIRDLSNPDEILAQIGAKAQAACNRAVAENDRMRPDDLLSKMRDRLVDGEFCSNIRSRYDVAIIDEFQDTDPIQWEIFKAIFLDRAFSGRLILVGDPKQSIYAFRSADVYTYLEATEAINQSGHFTLNRNYRSAPELVEGLNRLFGAATQLFPLPIRGSPLPFYPVESDESRVSTTFKDQKKRVHFIFGEGKPKKSGAKWPSEELEDRLIEWMGAEIMSLGVPNRSVAILIKDRHQARKVVERFKAKGIPALMSKLRHLTELNAYEALKDLLNAVLNPFNPSILKRALLGSICGWTFEELDEIERKEASGEAQTVEESIALLLHVQNLWRERGIATAAQTLFESVFPGKTYTIAERILRREEGGEYFDHLLQIVDLLCERETEHLLTPEALMAHYRDLTSGEYEEEVALKALQDQESDSVTVLTTHVSKGLEFDIVFAVGIAFRGGKKEALIPVKSGEERILVVAEEESEEEAQFLKEQDAEKGRQMYVALTRGKSRVYVPFFVEAGRDCEFEAGEAAPLELWAKSAGVSHPKELEEEYYSWSPLEETAEQQVAKQLRSIEIIEPIQRPVEFNPLWMQSYSSLTRNFGHSEIVGAPGEYKNPNKTVHTVPAGREIGILIHSILEEGKLSRWVEKEVAVPLLKQKIGSGRFLGWEEPIGEMLQYAVGSPLPRLGISLAKVDPQKMLFETEFILPAGSGPKIEGIHYREGYIHGIIDLLFEYEGKVYLVDWKTNWLGGDGSFYTEENLERAMVENAYHVQAKIYTAAANQYLARLGKGLVAGVYYIFMRGGIHSNAS